MAGKKASLLVLSETNVANVLNRLSTEEILFNVGRALRTLSVQDDSSTQRKSDVLQTPAIQNPLRITTSTPNHNLLYMPSRLGTSSTTSIKVVSVPRHPDDQTGLPATTLIFDEKTGQSKAVLNARSLTAVRTAAASALALSTSKHTKSAKTLLIYGAGLQAYWHARLVSSLSKDLNQVTIASRRITPRSEALAHDLTSFLHERAINVSSCSFEEAAKEGGSASLADIICCCTPSTVPLFPSERLKKGAGVTLIGSYKPHMQEIDLVPLAQEGRLKSVIVDSREACISEAGEVQRLLKALSISGQAEAKWLPELGQLVNEQGAPAEEIDEDLTIFKSVGVGVMDSAISALVLQKAEELSEYTEVPF